MFVFQALGFPKYCKCIFPQETREIANYAIYIFGFWQID